jgi:hypothetical protein
MPQNPQRPVRAVLGSTCLAGFISVQPMDVHQGERCTDFPPVFTRGLACNNHIKHGCCTFERVIAQSHQRTLHQVGSEIEHTPESYLGHAPGLILSHLSDFHPRNERHCAITPGCELGARLGRSAHQPGRLDLNGGELDRFATQCLGPRKV